MANRRFLQPWWLEVGTEICPICHHLYLYETEYRCDHCDGARCSDCDDAAQTNCLSCANGQEDSLEIELEV